MDIELSTREKKILLHLLTNNGVITTKELAELFSLSVRTIKYDLDNIRTWLAFRDYELVSKRGKGVWIDLADFQKLSLKNELLRLEKLNVSYDQSIRVHKLVFLLVSTTGYLTSNQLSESLQVSKNTIISDLDKVEILLNENNLVLQRTPRKGFKVTGEELSIRLGLEKIIQIEISEYDIYNIMNKLALSDSKDKTHQVYIGLTKEFQQTYETTLNFMTELLDPEVFERLNYSEILSITIRTAISVSRLTRQETIGTYKLLTDQHVLMKKQDLPYLLVQAVFENLSLPILEDEYYYIYGDVFQTDNNQDIKKITQMIIDHVTIQLSFPFDKDGILFTNLFAHLSLRLSREHMFINEYNPFVVDIKAKYPALYNAIKTVSEKVIDNASVIVNDSFVAYLALHFLVTIEKNRDQDSVRVVYVCSTGLGVTSLIQQKIQDEVSGLEIVSFASILNLREVIQSTLPDLIISIFPIEEVGIPWIKVNPIPSNEDIKKIQQTIYDFTEEQKNGFPKVKLKPRGQGKSNLSLEEESRDLIVKGFVVFESLKDLLDNQLDRKIQDSFLLHVFLMVHRIQFGSQYSDESINQQKIIRKHENLVVKIEQIFSENELAVNQSEIIALLQYLKGR